MFDPVIWNLPLPWAAEDRLLISYYLIAILETTGKAL